MTVQNMNKIATLFRTIMKSHSEAVNTPRLIVTYSEYTHSIHGHIMKAEDNN